MSTDDIKSIRVLSYIEALRSRPWVYIGDPYGYLGNPKNLLSTIIGVFTDSFLSLGVTEFTICESKNFFVIKSKQDWLKDKNNRDITYYFREGTTGPLRGEPFLPAFYFPFFTSGAVGKLGEPEIFEEYCGEEGSDGLEGHGRILIISKDQRLPINHGIIFKPPRSP